MQSRSRNEPIPLPPAFPTNGGFAVFQLSTVPRNKYLRWTAITFHVTYPIPTAPLSCPKNRLPKSQIKSPDKGNVQDRETRGKKRAIKGSSYYYTGED